MAQLVCTHSAALPRTVDTTRTHLLVYPVIIAGQVFGAINSGISHLPLIDLSYKNGYTHTKEWWYVKQELRQPSILGGVQRRGSPEMAGLGDPPTKIDV